jgi:hypothetical protein
MTAENQAMDIGRGWTFHLDAASAANSRSKGTVSFARLRERANSGCFRIILARPNRRTACVLVPSKPSTERLRGESGQDLRDAAKELAAIHNETANKPTSFSRN